MSIAYPLSLPTVTGIRSINLRARNAVGLSRSPFTFKEQVFSHGGQMLEAEISLPPMTRAEGEQWVSFLIKLKGMQGTFLLGDPAAATPRGSAATTPGTPVVSGAGQTGDDLTVSGLPADVDGYLLAGDYIQLGTSGTATLHKVLNDVDTSANGIGLIDLYPSIRTAPVDAAAVVVANAKGVFRLATNETNWSINEVTHYGLSFAAVEAIA
jgi:hypothetical protein